MRRAAHRFFEITAAVAAVVVITLSAGVYLIASGSVALDVLKPTIADTLADALGAEGVDFETAYLEWSEEGQRLHLKVREARIYGAEETVAVRVPELELGMSVQALSRGLVAPTQVIFNGASAQLVRTADGSLSMGLLPLDRGPRVVVSDSGTARVVDDAPAVAEPSAEEAGVGAGEDGGDLAARLARQLFAPPDPTSALGYLNEIAIRDARLRFSDRVSGSSVEAHHADLSLRRGDPGLELALDALLDLNGAPVEISVQGAQAEAGGGADLDLTFTDVSVAALADYVPDLAPITVFDGSLRGSVGVSLNEDGEVGALRADLVAGPGDIELGQPTTLPLVEERHLEAMLARVPERVAIRSAGLSVEVDTLADTFVLNGLSVLTDEARAIVSGRGALTFQPGEDWALDGLSFDLTAEDMTLAVPVYFEDIAQVDRLRLKGDLDLTGTQYRFDHIRLDAYGGSIDLAGRFGEVNGKTEVFLSGTIASIPATRLKHLWPVGPGQGARDWVSENIRQGEITQGTLTLEAPAGTFDVGYMPDEAMQLDFTLANVTSTFVRGLPPITDGQGEATLFGDSFQLRLQEGRIGRVEVRDVAMYTTGLHKRGAVGEFDAVIAGPMADILGLLDLGPFGYPSKYGIDPTRVQGQGSLRLDVSLPLLADVDMEQIEFAAAANVEDMAVPGLIGGLDLHDGSLFLQINGEGLSGQGDLKIAGVQGTLDWREVFIDGAELPSTFVITTVLDDTARETFGLDAGGVISGPVLVEATARGRGAELTDIQVHADLRDSAIDLGEALWQKPAGETASARLTVNVEPDGRILARNLRMEGRNVTLTGGFELASDASLAAADFPVVKLGSLTDFAVRARREDDAEALHVMLTGAYLNAGPLLDGVMSGASGSGESVSAGRPFRLTANLGRIDLLNEVSLSNPTLSMEAAKGTLEDLRLSGTFDGTGTVNVDLARDGPTTRTLIVSATDAGALARGVFGTDSVNGGRFRLDAALTELGTPENDIDVQGQLAVDSFRVVNVPLLARLLTVGSFTGLNDLLQGEGIWFDRLDVPFMSHEGAWWVDEGRAYGPSLGITMDGGLNADMAATDLHGTIVPAYQINSALGRVPVIGDLFVGREGEGVIGITYRIVGSGEGSSIYVNPLSALAPGFLRRLFQIGAGDGDELGTTAPDTQPE